MVLPQILCLLKVQLIWPSDQRSMYIMHLRNLLPIGLAQLKVMGPINSLDPLP